MSAWLGRRDSASHGDADRWPTKSFAARFQAQASVIVNVHKHMWSAPTLARTNHRTCLLSRSDDFFHVAERDLDGSGMMPSKVELGRAGSP